MDRNRSRSPIFGKPDFDEDDNDGRFDRKRYDKSRSSSPSDRRGGRGGRRSRSRDRGGRGGGGMRIYIGNLPFSFKWQDLKDLLKERVGEVGYVDVYEESDGRPKGIAMVEYRDESNARLALDKLDGYDAKGRRLRVYTKDEAMRSPEFRSIFRKGGGGDRRGGGGPEPWSSRGPSMRGDDGFVGDTYGLPPSLLRSLKINGPIVNRVFVANIDFESTEKEIEQLFSIAGKVTDVDLVCDSEGKRKGFAVIEFEHPLHSVQAISMLNNQNYKGRDLYVRMNKDEYNKRPPGTAKLPPGLKGVGSGLGVNGNAVTDPSSIVSALSSQFSSNQGPSDMGGNFNPMGMNMGSRNNPLNSLAANPMALAAAAALTMQNPMGNMNSSNFSNMGGRLGQNSGPMGGVMGNDGYNGSMGGMNQGYGNGSVGRGGYDDDRGSNWRSGGGGNSTNDLKNNSSINPSSFGLGTVVQIKNLPPDYTWKNLKDLCYDYGEVRFTEISGPGEGLIRFGSGSSASRAVDNLDNQRFDGRLLQARIL